MEQGTRKPLDWDFSTDEIALAVEVRAVETWGKQKQIDIAIEEMAELTKALLKERRACNADSSAIGNHDAALANIAEEMADVHIMLAQLEIIFGNWNEWRRQEALKLERLERRIRESRGGAYE